MNAYHPRSRSSRKGMTHMRRFTQSLVLGAVVLGATAPVQSDSPANQLAGQIETRVRQAINAARSSSQEASVVQFEQSAATATWSEIWPAAGGETTREVTERLWDAPIRMALAKHDAVFLPKQDEPYYIGEPIVLKSGQRLCADREAEIRLVPGSNTCMVRNESLLSGQNGPIPADAMPDTQITIDGGIWTTLATSPTQSNGNVHGRSARQPVVPACHGVIILSNVRGVTIRNVVVRRSRAHAVQLSNCREFLVEGVAFDEHRRDGIHVNGPAGYGIIRDIRGATGDDFVALNAWDWRNTAPAFGPIHHILVEAIHGSPQLGGTAEIRLLPGTKTFSDGVKLACSIHDCVLRDLHDIRTFKIYDQPNLELGRGRDFCDPIGTIRNVFFDKLTFSRPGRFQVAVNVDGLSINDVQLNYDANTTGKDYAKLVEIGPMSQTYKFDADNPATWVELFSPDHDITVRNFSLTNVRVKTGDTVQPLQHAADHLVRIADQRPNPDYPKTTPRGGTGKAIFVP
jgi:hypothetical protein